MYRLTTYIYCKQMDQTRARKLVTSTHVQLSFCVSFLCCKFQNIFMKKGSKKKFFQLHNFLGLSTYENKYVMMYCLMFYIVLPFKVQNNLYDGRVHRDLSKDQNKQSENVGTLL